MDEKVDEVYKMKNGITKTITNLPLQWTENLTVLDLSGQNLQNIEENVHFPNNLSELNLSHNNLEEVPCIVISLKKLKILDLSNNRLVLFDNEPEFCNSIERMDLSNNALVGPPYWVWTHCPQKLYYLNLHGNQFITNSFIDGYLEELLTYTTSLTEIDMCNCHLTSHSIKLLSTLAKAKKLTLGISDYNYLSTNYLIELPCKGLDTLCDVEILNVTNTHIYTLNSNIDLYKNLREINLSENSINSLPNEFCSLATLEICLLSFNKLLYLPENIKNLTNLRILCIDSNELCMITENLCKLENLKVLDLYDNYLCEVPETLMEMVAEIDLAQNYFEEPEFTDYLDKKLRIRLNKVPRDDGRKIEIIHVEDDHSPDTTDDENFMLSINNDSSENVPGTQQCESSSENWDSDNDDYWIPHYPNNYTPPRSPYLLHLKKMIEEGNFCPFDFHTLSVAEQVLYEKRCNPTETYESEGQFDDCSSDGS